MNDIEFQFNMDADPISSTDGFEYDLFYGGYLEPEKFLIDKSQIRKVKEAIEIINEYKEQLIDSGLYEEC